MEYANKKIISISAAVAVLVIIIAAFSCKGVLDSYKKEQQKCEVFSTATVSQGYKVKSYPLSVAFTNGKIEQTGDIKNFGAPRQLVQNNLCCKRQNQRGLY